MQRLDDLRGGLRGSLGDEQALRDRSVREALRNQGKRFPLTLGEFGGAGPA
jgi:hypothetical protein